MAGHHDYHIAAEKDTSGAVNRHIWYYLIGLGVILFLTILGLDIMYRFQVDYEKTKKIGEVLVPAAKQEVTRVQSILSGKKGLIENKHHVLIEEAMEKFLSDIRRAR